jgi:transposase
LDGRMIFMPKQYPRELRERAVRLVAEQRDQYETEYAAIRSIAAKLGIATPESLRKWVRQAEIDGGQRPGVSSEESAEVRRLRAEVKELRRANEILKAASAFFAAELDRPLTRS